MKKEDFEVLIQQARRADLLDYFQKSGYTVRKHGGEYYVEEFPSLCIKAETNAWFFHYSSKGATNNSIDCLVHVLDKDFRQAVFELTGQDVSLARSSSYPQEQRPRYTAPPRPAQPVPQKRELQMPQQAENMRRVFAYLCQSRKIPAAIVEELAHTGLLYQSENTVHSIAEGEQKIFHNANAVFVHRSTSGDVVGAEIQGCNSFRRYKGVAPGTGDSAFVFVPVPAKDNRIRRAYLFESAIDLLSFYTFCTDKQKLVGSALVSMAGLKPTVPKQMQAAGIQIVSCVDNDDAGRKFEQENGFIRSEFVKQKLDSQGFKDWNELLVFRTGDTNNAANVSQPAQPEKRANFFRR